MPPVMKLASATVTMKFNCTAATPTRRGAISTSTFRTAGLLNPQPGV